MKVALSLSVVLLIATPPRAHAASDPAALFARKCSSCHTFGKGDRVGPDLKGATDRHTRPWLIAWIRSSDNVIRSGDRAAALLFNKYKQQRMPDQNFSSTEIAALLDYLAASGPEAAERTNSRRAETATPADVEMGRSLFVGSRAFTSSGTSCISCHTVGDDAAGGSLGPELTHAYSKFQDKRLSVLLDRACFPREPLAPDRKALTEQESFAIRAFLRDADAGRRVSTEPGRDAFPKR